ncbi:hypothetical protein QBC39DRAFT_20427 [Podospora conica]|nr:hypothetical protein QBC39DRAFT_20427 [Schizothecium conicum]
MAKNRLPHCLYTLHNPNGNPSPTRLQPGPAPPPRTRTPLRSGHPPPLAWKLFSSAKPPTPRQTKTPNKMYQSFSFCPLFPPITQALSPLLNSMWRLMCKKQKTRQKNANVCNRPTTFFLSAPLTATIAVCLSLYYPPPPPPPPSSPPFRPSPLKIKKHKANLLAGISKNPRPTLPPPAPAPAPLPPSVKTQASQNTKDDAQCLVADNKRKKTDTRESPPLPLLSSGAPQ